MAFSRSTINAAYKRSEGRCECERCHLGMTDAPHHGRRCSAVISKKDKWTAHHKHPAPHGGEDDSLSNCEILCPVCSRLVETFGTDTYDDPF